MKKIISKMTTVMMITLFLMALSIVELKISEATYLSGSIELGTLIIHKEIDGTPIQGTTFDIYKVDDETISTATPTDSEVIATKQTIITDTTGEASLLIEDLGRYLVVESSSTNSTKRISNFLVDVPTTVPGNPTDTLEYVVEVYPKSETSYGEVTLTNIGKTATATENLVGSTFKLQKLSGTTWEDTTNEVLTTDSNGQIKVAGLDIGSYRFIQQSVLNNYILDNKTVYEFNVTADETGELQVSNSTITVVNEKPTLTKEITSSLVNGSVKIGQEVNYKLTIDLIPEVLERLNTFEIKDILPEGLNYKENSLNVSLVMPTEPNAIWQENWYEYDYDATDRALTVDILDRNYAKNGDSIEITYTAIVSEDAIANENGMKNIATLTYSLIVDKDHDDQVNTEKAETLIDDVTVYTGGFWVLKVAQKEDGEPLAGAVFKIATSEAFAKAGIFIKDASGNEIEIVSGQDGKASYKGLELGTYWLVEVKAPTYEENGETKSYNLLRSPQEIEVTKTSYESTTPAKIIINKTGIQLPATGGVGAAIIITLGLVFVVIGVKTMKDDSKKSVKK